MDCGSPYIHHNNNFIFSLPFLLNPRPKTQNPMEMSILLSIPSFPADQRSEEAEWTTGIKTSASSSDGTRAKKHWVAAKELKLSYYTSISEIYFLLYTHILAS